jgi:hypothetical protein
MTGKFRWVSVGNTASIFRAISGGFWPFHPNAPENALDPAVSDRTYLTWVIENLQIDAALFIPPIPLNYLYLYISIAFIPSYQLYLYTTYTSIPPIPLYYLYLCTTYISISPIPSYHPYLHTTYISITPIPPSHLYLYITYTS